MTKKKHYESPSMEVVELKLQGSLLAGSGSKDDTTDDSSMDGTINKTYRLQDFDESWD